VRALGLALALGLAAGCPEAASDAEGLPPVATVGARTVEADALLMSLDALARQGDLPRDRAFAALRGRTLDARIVEEVLLQEAEERGIKVSDAAFADELLRLEGDPPEPGIRADAIALYGDAATWHAVVRRRLLVTTTEAALRAELREGITVTPEQVEAAIPRYADRLSRPNRIRARQLFHKDPDVVRALHARLEQGEDFVALADELGLEAGGDLGVMTVESAPTLLVQAAESLKRGEHSAVLRSPLGYHVFLLVARTMGGTVPDDEARASVEGWLLDEAVESRLRLWLAATTDELGLSVDEDVLARVRCCRDGRPYLAPEESS